MVTGAVVLRRTLGTSDLCLSSDLCPLTFDLLQGLSC